ncbi:MAG: RsmE family RNA methyltransferase [Candidatus Geothermincolia bacterium]
MALSFPRFYISPEAIVGDRAELSGKEAEHLVRSLRARPGDLIPLGDGAGRVMLGRLENCAHAEVVLKIVKDAYVAPRVPSLHLYQASIRGALMESLVRQNTELGIESIRIFEGERTVRAPGGGARRLRLERIALEAAKQSRRAHLAEVRAVAGEDELLAEAQEYDCVLVAWEPGAPRPAELLPAEAPPRVALVIGPEGGFSEREAGEMLERGARLCGLGPNVLRAETAGLVLHAAVLSHYGLL